MVFGQPLCCTVGVPSLQGGRLGFPEAVDELDWGKCGLEELRVWAAKVSGK